MTTRKRRLKATPVKTTSATQPIKRKRRARKKTPREHPAPSPLVNTDDTMADEDDIEAKVAELCEESGTPMPVEFLATVMSGRDPRRNSNIYKHLMVIRNECGDDPPEPGSWLWEEMVSMIEYDYQPAPVTLQESQAAAKQVAEYLHSKKRMHHITAEITNIEVKKLTRQEIRLFNNTFNSRY